MLSPMDDYPIHQVAEPVRLPGTSDRNFYDRYYFNAHACSDELFLVAGLGQYPNLGVTDAFVSVRRGGFQHVVRASRELGVDRFDTRVGPIRVEVIEGLKRLRLVCDAAEEGIACDLTWQAAVPAVLEPRHQHRHLGQVVYDTARLAQTGFWSGALSVHGEDFTVTPDRWHGARDRSWGVRSVGHPAHPGIAGAHPPAGFFWLYAPIQLADSTILCIVQEEADGTRVMEEALRVWPEDTGRPVERLGHPHHDLEFQAGTRTVTGGTLTFTPPGGAPLTVRFDIALPFHLNLGTGYARDDTEWRHGMYQGALKVEGRSYDLADDDVRARLVGVVDALARYECDGQVAHSLFEYAVFGANDRYGFPAATAAAGPQRK